nr:MAG TPA: hypothetical protein [Caudoviricetes sp.]
MMNIHRAMLCLFIVRHESHLACFVSNRGYYRTHLISPYGIFYKKYSNLLHPVEVVKYD